MGAFPHFKDLVQDILQDDLKAIKAKAEENLDMLVDIHNGSSTVSITSLPRSVKGSKINCACNFLNVI